MLAQRARLEAEQTGQQRLQAPTDFAMLQGEDQAAAMEALRLQQKELNVRRATLAAQRDALRQRSVQADAQGGGYGTQVVSANEQLRLVNEQLADLQPLAERGFVSRTRMRELERVRAGLIGQRGQYAASVAQSRGVAREGELNALEADRTFAERTSAELRDVDTRLGDVLPRWTAARDQLARTQIRAPTTGAVIGLSVFTPGGVIASGQKLMDIVPERAPLRIQVRVGVDDADDLHIGQSAHVRFPTLHERQLPDLNGELTKLSADALTDERTGASYFTAELIVPKTQIALLDKVRGKDFQLRPGMPVQVLVPLRKRTALDYALEPLVGAFWTAFNEH